MACMGSLTLLTMEGVSYSMYVPVCHMCMYVFVAKLAQESEVRNPTFYHATSNPADDSTMQDAMITMMRGKLRIEEERRSADMATMTLTSAKHGCSMQGPDPL